jgi:hypothetical protein
MSLVKIKYINHLRKLGIYGKVLKTILESERARIFFFNIFLGYFLYFLFKKESYEVLK